MASANLIQTTLQRLQVTEVLCMQDHDGDPKMGDMVTFQPWIVIVGSDVGDLDGFGAKSGQHKALPQEIAAFIVKK